MNLFSHLSYDCWLLFHELFLCYDWLSMFLLQEVVHDHWIPLHINKRVCRQFIPQKGQEDKEYVQLISRKTTVEHPWPVISLSGHLLFTVKNCCHVLFIRSVLATLLDGHPRLHPKHWRTRKFSSMMRTARLLTRRGVSLPLSQHPPPFTETPLWTGKHLWKHYKEGSTIHGICSWTKAVERPQCVFWTLTNLSGDRSVLKI